MKNIFKRGLSLVLSLSLAFSLMAVGASAEDFADMPNGWPGKRGRPPAGKPEPAARRHFGGVAYPVE